MKNIDESKHNKLGSAWVRDLDNPDDMVQVATVTPDFAAIADARNGWFENGELPSELEDEVNRRAARLLYEVMDFVTDGIQFDSKRGMYRALIRMLAVIWLLAPTMLRTKKEKVVSLEDMAQALGKTRCWISMVAEDFSNRFTFFTRNQKSQRSRVNYARAATQGWEKRRAKASQST
jgi:hypothetical protein